MIVIAVGTFMTGCASAASSRSVTLDADQGWATVRCTGRADGSVSDCRVIAESHPGQGFGEAAVRTVSRGKLNARTVGGVAEDATFNVTVRFALEDGAPIQTPRR